MNAWLPTVACMAMIEYLVKRIDGEDHSDWPIHKDRYPEILRSNTMPPEQVSGWGHHRIAVAGVEVSFSWEQVGFHVSFEGDLDQETAAQIVSEIADNLEAAVDGRAEVTQIAGWE